MGQVYLIGAGPGNPKLLTIQAQEILQQADCVIYDRLGTQEILGYLPKECEKIYVGKQQGNHTIPQSQINQLLKEKSQQYATVVRLKGGDPYVFGRGGEEGLYLQQQGISFVVIPGITSAISGLSWAGIPITHRNLARGFRVYTAHDSQDGWGDMDFASMANTGDTLVFLMGLSRIEDLTKQLLQAGKAPDTPTAVISNATLPIQKVVVACLENLAEETKREQLQSPALIVVGEVISLSERLNWYKKQPLFGKRILFPRTGENSTLEKLLQQQGAEVAMVQVSRLELLESAWDNICKGAGCEWIAFTSRNGVKFFFDSVKKNGQDARCLAGTMVAAIGKATAKELEKYNICADFIAENATTEAFAKKLQQEILPTERLLLICPEISLEESWQEQPYIVIPAPVYRNMPCLPVNLPPVGFDATIFTCASSVDRVEKALQNQSLQEYIGKTVFAIGKKNANALNQRGIQCLVAPNADYNSLVDTIIKHFNEEGKENESIL